MQPTEIKQVIVLRTKYPDKNGNMVKVRSGKLCAQACHASMAVLLNRKTPFLNWLGLLLIPLNHKMIKWVTGSFAKIVVYVETEEELFRAYQEAQKLKIPSAIIRDSGRTEFHGNPTYTAVAIGPDFSGKIDLMTGKLPLW